MKKRHTHGEHAAKTYEQLTNQTSIKKPHIIRPKHLQPCLQQTL